MRYPRWRLIAVLVSALGLGACGDKGAAPPADATTPDSYVLSILKTGVGSGTVSGTGISCGADCSEPFLKASTVILTATPDSGSAFSGWSGCAASSGQSCTVALDQDKSVTATFGHNITSAIVITSLPATSTTGTYTLGFSVTGSVPTPYLIQEAPDTSFSLANRTVYSTYGTSYSFSSKPDGIYCYQIATSIVSSAPACITVARPTTAVLRITNNTRYAMIDIRLNGTQKAAYPYGIPPGQSFDFLFGSSGTVTYNLGVGFYNSDGSRNVWFTASGSTTVTAGLTTPLAMQNPTLGQMLTGFNPAGRDWTGPYWCYSCNPILGYARYRFNSTAGWSFYDNDVFKASGTATLVSWPDYATAIGFKLCPTCDTITLYYPFATFYYRNGPADWPVIEYVRQ
ncbi:MAG TPA: hypothetical protein VGA00_06825 [Acidiferrobacterales bacterium]